VHGHVLVSDPPKIRSETQCPYTEILCFFVIRLSLTWLTWIRRRVVDQEYKPPHFVAFIELGNDAMQSPDQIADALLQAVRGLRCGRGNGIISDFNGNRVGYWNLGEIRVEILAVQVRHDDV
jgi:hypothetical protein